MKKIASALFLTLFAGTVFATTPVAAGGDNTYVKLLGNVFELQIQMLEHLVKTDKDYVANAHRHAEDIISTADLLTDSIDSLDLGASKTAKIELKKLNDATYIAAKDLARAIKRWQEGKEKQNVVEALKNLRVTCDNCHSYGG